MIGAYWRYVIDQVQGVFAWADRKLRGRRKKMKLDLDNVPGLSNERAKELLDEMMKRE